MLSLVYIVAALASAAVVAAFTYGAVFIPRIRRGLAEVPWKALRLPPPDDRGEDRQFTTRGGLVLRASFLPAASPRPLGTVLFCHGLGSDRWDVVLCLDALRRGGFGVFTFDFRNHGASDREPSYEPLPWLTQREVEDVEAAIAYVIGSPAGCGPVSLMGLSRGADAALCAAAGDARISAVVADGAFPSGALQRHYLRRFMRIYPFARWLSGYLPELCLAGLCACANLLFRLRGGHRLVSVERKARRVRQPVLMIHGGSDTAVPAVLAERLREHLAGDSEFWIVPNAGHNQAAAAAGEEYARRVTGFLLRTQSAGNALRGVS